MSRVRHLTLDERRHLRQIGLAFASEVDALYKFRSFSGASRRRVLDIIRTSRIYCARATEFNDPFDVMPTFRYSGDPKDPAFVAALRRRQDEIAAAQGLSAVEIAKLKRQLNSTVHDLPTLVEKQIRGVLRKNKGLCLHFSSTRRSIFGEAVRVRYSSDRKAIFMSPKPMHRNVAHRLVYTKAKFWSYEHEYRLVRPDHLDQIQPLEEGGFLRFSPHLLTGMSLGSQMPKKDCTQLIQHAADHNPHMDIWQMSEDTDRFQLNEERRHSWATGGTSSAGASVT